MKKFLIPLLAAIVLPTDVKANTVWLLLKVTQGAHGVHQEKILMEDMESCISEGERWINNPTTRRNTKYFQTSHFHCLLGK